MSSRHLRQMTSTQYESTNQPRNNKTQNTSLGWSIHIAIKLIHPSLQPTTDLTPGKKSDKDASTTQQHSTTHVYLSEYMQVVRLNNAAQLSTPNNYLSARHIYFRFQCSDCIQIISYEIDKFGSEFKLSVANNY